MSQNGCSCLNTGCSLNTLCHGLRMSNTFCIDNNMMFFTFFTVINNIVDDSLLIIIVFFRKQDILCTIGNTAPQGQVSGISSHNFDNTYTLMRSGSITNLVNSFHCCIYSCIKSDCIFCTGNIQVNGSRHTYGINSQICQFLSTCKGTVTADNNKSVNPVLSANLCCSFLTFFCTHFCTAGCIENGTALLNGIGNIHSRHINNFFVNETAVSF